MQNNNTFKDFPGQSHIELKFNAREQHTLEREEALQKYRRNISLLSKIFAYDVEKEQLEQETIQESQNEIQNTQIDEKQLSSLRNSLLQLSEKHAQILEQYRIKSALFGTRMKESLVINAQEELDNLISQLQQDNLIDEEHPYFDMKSSFHMKWAQQQPIQLSYDVCQAFKNQMKDESSIILS